MTDGWQITPRRAIVAGVVVFLTANASLAKYSGGTGDANNPYRIGTAADLNGSGRLRRTRS